MKFIKFLFVFFISHVYSQSYHLTGEIVDVYQKPIHNAGVYLIKKSDSTVINFTKTDEKGLFNLKISKQKEELVLNSLSLNYL